MSKTSPGFKSILAVVGTILGILFALQPYLSLVARADQAESDYRALKQKVEMDHDLIIGMAHDIRYIKDHIKETREQRNR